MKRGIDDLSASDSANWRDDYWDHLVRAQVYREEGKNKEALKELDAASELQIQMTGEVPKSKQKRERRRPKLSEMARDPDSTAIELMNRRSAMTGETDAGKLADWVLKAPIANFQSRESARKRLKRKWRAQVKA